MHFKSAYNSMAPWCFCLLLSLLFPAGKKIIQQANRLKNSSVYRYFVYHRRRRSRRFLMQQMIQVSGWKKGDIMVAIPLSSTYDSAYHWINDQLQQMTGQACVRFDSSAIHDVAKLDSLRKAKIIFIGGGDQSRMMQLIEGSTVKKMIQEAYHNGATIGGTSAGAAIMSELMITGNQLLDTAYQSTFPVLRSENLELKEGLGLLDSVIVDMHFIARSRYNRLLSAVIEHPNYLCIGIDETTALIIHGDSATVAGESQVVTIATPDRIKKEKIGLLVQVDWMFRFIFRVINSGLRSNPADYILIFDHIPHDSTI